MKTSDTANGGRLCQFFAKFIKGSPLYAYVIGFVASESSEDEIKSAGAGGVRNIVNSLAEDI
jgi:hypothetical protein